MGLRGLAFSSLLAVLALAVAAQAPGAEQAAPAKYVCNGPEGTLFDNTNVNGVDNGGASPTFSTNGKTFCVTYIEHYHWNDSNGAPGGAVGLKRVGGAGAQGQLPAQIVSKAKTSAGQGRSEERRVGKECRS